MTYRLDPKRVPGHIAEKARKHQDQVFLLPTGAKCWWKKHVGLMGYGYGDNRDVLIYAMPKHRKGMFQVALFTKKGNPVTYLFTPGIGQCVWPHGGNLYNSCSSRIMNMYLKRMDMRGLTEAGFYLGFISAEDPPAGMGYPMGPYWNETWESLEAEYEKLDDKGLIHDRELIVAG